MTRLGWGLRELAPALLFVGSVLSTPLSPRQAGHTTVHYLHHVEPSETTHDSELDKVFADDRSDFASGHADVNRLLHSGDLQAILPSASVHTARWATPLQRTATDPAPSPDGGLGDFWVKNDPWRDLPTLEHYDPTHAEEVDEIFGKKPPAAPLMSLAQTPSRGTASTASGAARKASISAVQSAFEALHQPAQKAGAKTRLKSDAAALKALDSMSALFQNDAKKQASLLTKRLGHITKKMKSHLSSLSAKPKARATKARIVGLAVDKNNLERLAESQRSHEMHIRATDDITAAAHNPWADVRAPQAKSFLYSPAKPQELRAPSPRHHEDVHAILKGIDDGHAPAPQLALKMILHRAKPKPEPLHTPEVVQSNNEMKSHDAQTANIFDFAPEDEHGGKYRLHYKSPY